MKLLVCLILVAVVGTAQLVRAQNQTQSLLDELLAVETQGADPCRYADDGVCDVPKYCRKGDFNDCGTGKKINWIYFGRTGEKVECSCTEFVRLYAEQWIIQNHKTFAEESGHHGYGGINQMRSAKLRAGGRGTSIVQQCMTKFDKVCGGVDRLLNKVNGKWVDTQQGYDDMSRGDGDCDTARHCRGNLKCGQNNCLQRRFGDPWVRSSLYVEDCDCCIAPSEKSGSASKLQEGEGDCDSNSECASGLKCGDANCIYFDGTHKGGTGTLHGDSYKKNGVYDGKNKFGERQLVQYNHKITGGVATIVNDGRRRRNGNSQAWRYGNGPLWSYGRYQPWFEPGDDCCYNPNKKLTASDYKQRLYTKNPVSKTYKMSEMNLLLNATSPEVSLEEDVAEEGKWTASDMVCSVW